MKTPLGLIYAILITIAILAVVLFARSQSSSMISPASLHVPLPESTADKPPAEPADEPAAKDAQQQPAREKAAE